MNTPARMALKIGLFLIVAVVIGVLWNVAVTAMFTSESVMLGKIAFWLGRWTFTGWIFYLVLVFLVYWLLAKYILKAKPPS